MQIKHQSNVQTPSDKNRETLYQVSLLQSMAYGDYNGSVAVKELKAHGDIGIGTFHRLNGELIMLEGEVYRAAADGSVEAVDEEETSPFAVVSYMDADLSKTLKDIPDYRTLNDALDQLVEERGKNRFYMIRIDGLFREINVRSVPAQSEPYQRLVDVLAHQQTLFDYEHIEGTMVGLYCPPYMSYLNAAGWHMHFISKDKSQGGHVLGANIANAVLSVHDINSFHLQLPQNNRFDRFDLTLDQSEDIEKIEKNS